ncbi:MAG: winged helix-turn-helix transcriptional regulator [Alphaproteobacteria bacterium]
MSAYNQFCPIAMASEVLLGRWTPLILREMFYGAKRFSDIQRGVPLMSRTLLARRLREMEADGLIASSRKSDGPGREYRLTKSGEQMRPMMEFLAQWGQQWTADKVGPEELDPSLALWGLRRSVDRAQLPDRRVVVQFQFRGVPRLRTAIRLGWLVLTRDEVDVCLKDPGYDVDLVVRADLGSLVRVWMGYADHAEMLARGAIAFDGPAGYARDFWKWIGVVGKPRRETFLPGAIPAAPGAH